MIDLLVSWLGKVIAEFMQLAVSYLGGILGFDFVLFNTTFPFALDAYEIFQRIGLALVLVIAVVHLWPWFFPSDSRSRTSPFRIAFFSILAVGFIFYGNYLFEGIIDLATYPYNALLGADAATNDNWLQFESATAVIGDVFYQQSLIMYIIVMLLIGIAFLKLLLEAVERYVILFMLIYASPLASATLASDATNGVFKKFFSMFISQCILVILNIWVLKLVISMFSNLSASASPVLALLMGYSVLRVGAKMDSYLNQLGLNAAVTGIGLAGELMGAGMAMAAIAGGRFPGSALGGGGRNSGGSGNSGGILGFGKNAANAIGKTSPISGAADAVRNYSAATAKTAGQAMNAAVDAHKSGGSMVNATIDSVRGNFKNNMHDATTKTSESSFYARAATSKYRNNITDKMSGASQEGLSDMERAAVAHNSHLADAAYSATANSDYEVSRAEDVGAVMQGIGAETADPAAGEFVDVAYGNTNAENVNFTMDADGIHASYVKDGKLHEASVVNSTQYAALSSEEQHGYTGFKSHDGKKYYQRFSSQRVEKPKK